MIRSDGKAVYKTKAPDTITSWVANAFAISDKNGIGVAKTKANVQYFLYNNNNINLLLY